MCPCTKVLSICRQLGLRSSCLSRRYAISHDGTYWRRRAASNFCQLQSIQEVHNGFPSAVRSQKHPRTNTGEGRAKREEDFLCEDLELLTQHKTLLDLLFGAAIKPLPNTKPSRANPPAMEFSDVLYAHPEEDQIRGMDSSR
jgi:hypothetical protein